MFCLVKVQFHMKETVENLTELRLLSPPFAGSCFFSWQTSLSSCLGPDILLLRNLEGKWSLTITSILNWEVIKTQNISIMQSETPEMLQDWLSQKQVCAQAIPKCFSMYKNNKENLGVGFLQLQQIQFAFNYTLCFLFFLSGHLSGMLHFNKFINLYKFMNTFMGCYLSWLPICLYAKKQYLHLFDIICSFLIQQLVLRKHFNFAQGYVYENHRFNNCDSVSILRCQLHNNVLFSDYNSRQSQSR